MFLSARYRPNVWPFWALMVIEFCLTVALLAFVGIAAPNLYRTKLWQDGSENGFNSSPTAGMYAAANYKPYKTPRVWSQFTTNYNLVVVVFSMFLMLVKSIMYMLHVFPPIINCVVHTGLSIIYIVAITFQAGSDTTDPTRMQRGAPWYITKSCSVAKHQSNVGYCQQAKATFGCFIAMLLVYLTYFGFALFSCFPSKQHQVEIAEKRRLRQEKYPSMYASAGAGPPKTAKSDVYTIPDTPGIENLPPMTPRTFAFNKLSGTKNMPLRMQIGKRSADQSSNTVSIPLRSPAPPTSQVQQPQYSEDVIKAEEGGQKGKAPMYFPPPPKSLKPSK